MFYGCFSYLALSSWKVLLVKVLSSLCLTVEVKSTCSGNVPLKKNFYASAAVEEYEGPGEISFLQKPVEELGWTRRSSKGSMVT